MESTLDIFVKAIFSENMIFAYFLGMCSYLAVSKTVKTAVGLGAAVIFVLTVTVPLNWLLDQYILQRGALGWLGAEYADYDLSFLSFISTTTIGLALTILLACNIDKPTLPAPNIKIFFFFTIQITYEAK